MNYTLGTVGRDQHATFLHNFIYILCCLYLLRRLMQIELTACIMHRIFKDNISLNAHIIFYEKMAAQINVCIAIF